jgi:hypothetical protein
MADSPLLESLKKKNLKKIGTSSYATEDYNTEWLDWLKSFFVTPTTPKDLPPFTSQDETTVRAPYPKYGTPFPDNIDEIYLGTKTSPPSGTYTPNEGDKPRINAWDGSQTARAKKAFEQYPFTQKFVSDIDWQPMRSSLRGYTQHDPDNKSLKSGITLNPEGADQDATLFHELSHATQRARHPDIVESMFDYIGSLDAQKEETDPFKRYQKRNGEEIARAVAAAAMRKRRK